MFKRVAEDSSSILHFSVEFIPRMVDCLLVASRRRQPPTEQMKLIEPPTWIAVILSAIAGAAFIGAAIILKEFVHSY